MTSFDFDVIGDSPKPLRQPAQPEAQKPPAEQKPEHSAQDRESRTKTDRAA